LWHQQKLGTAVPAISPWNHRFEAFDIAVGQPRTPTPAVQAKVCQGAGEAEGIAAPADPFASLPPKWV
jgi:hypothetical protein